MHDKKVRDTFYHANVSLAVGLLGGVMTERMQSYRQRMEEKGFIQVRMWIEKQDEEFVKFVAKFCRDRSKPPKESKEKKRFGRRASDEQIRFVKKLAKAKGLPEPEHLYDYHISLSAWTWRYKDPSRSEW